MKKWILGVVVILVLSLVIGVGWVYQYGGLRYYLRATSYINKLSGEEKTKASQDFHVDKEGFYSGTLAGTWGGKVWVWGRKGLKHYNVDQYSVYFYTDGCSDKAPRVIYRDIILDFAGWNQNAEPGDFVTILIAREANGGTLGNLREIYTYNWWTFLGKDMKTECAK